VPIRARKADQHRRQGRQPWPIRHLPNGQGRGVAEDIRGNPVADRPAAGTAQASMTGRSGQMQQTTTAEVRLDEGKAVRLGLRSRAPRRFGCPRVICDRIPLQRSSPRREYRAQPAGNRRMLDQEFLAMIESTDIDWHVTDLSPIWAANQSSIGHAARHNTNPENHSSAMTGKALLVAAPFGIHACAS
jgi:hypothetical protein